MTWYSLHVHMRTISQNTVTSVNYQETYLVPALKVCVFVAVYMHSSTRDTTVTSDRGRVECIDVYTRDARVKIEDEVVIYFDIHDG